MNKAAATLALALLFLMNPWTRGASGAEPTPPALHGLTIPQFALYLEEQARERERLEIKPADAVAQFAIQGLGTPVERTAQSDQIEVTNGPCLVNRCVAAALAKSWSDYYALLVRLNFADGELRLTKRNTFLLADWPRNNAWAVDNMTREIASENNIATTDYPFVYPKAAWLKGLAELGRAKTPTEEEMKASYFEPVPVLTLADSRRCYGSLRKGDVIFWVYEHRSVPDAIEDHGMAILVDNGPPAVVLEYRERIAALPLAEARDQAVGIIVVRLKEHIDVQKELDLVRSRNIITPSPADIERLRAHEVQRLRTWFNLPMSVFPREG